jgi:DNA-binding NarL/FixJ family response regulator
MARGGRLSTARPWNGSWPPQVTAAPSDPHSQPGSPPEKPILRLLALGLSTRKIAERLVITTKTADHHVQHIYTKIGVSTRGAAALFAIENGILATEA